MSINVKMRGFLATAGALVFLASDSATADCGHGYDDACMAQEATQEVDGVTFVWRFNCNGDDCLVGEFIHGDPWVVHPDGGDVEITSVTPDDADSGLQKNPASAELVAQKNHRDRVGIPQGLFAGSGDGSGPYDPDLDLSRQFPIMAPPDNGVYVKAKAYLGGDCGYTRAVGENCVESYSALTVLSDLPPDGELGKQTFRPGAAGEDKRIFTTDDFDLGRIPQFSEIDSPDYGSDNFRRWARPYPDYFTGINGDQGRRWAPKARGVHDYAMFRAHQNISRTFSLMANDPWTDEKKMAAYSMLQYSIELLGGYEEGVIWSGGAGQHQGYWHPVVFLAAVVTDEDVVASVQSATDRMGTFVDGRSEGENPQFAELYQVREGVHGQPIWGSSRGRDGCPAGSDIGGHGGYWAKYSDFMLRGDKPNSTCGDPYGYIDGPARTPGSSYASCCSTGLYVTIGLMQKIWPEFADAANNPVMKGFVERLYDRGWSVEGDEVAKPDPRENEECAPFRASDRRSTCEYFGETWGWNPDTETYISIAEAERAGHPDPGPRWEDHMEEIETTRPSLNRDNPGSVYWDDLTSGSRSAAPEAPSWAE